ncbi:MAG: DUF2207 domain-containing protein [Deinococcota bacterium]
MIQVHQQESIQDSHKNAYNHPRGHSPKFLVSMVLLFAISVSLAQTYTWHNVVQTIDIQANGDVLVTDERTLIATGGDFGEAFVEVRLADGQTLTMLTEESGAVTTWRGATAYQNRIDDGQEVVVGNPNQATQTRIRESRVRYVYRLTNTLDVYSDVVQWYWNVLGREGAEVVGYTLTVNAPRAMNAPYDAFVHRYNNPEQPLVRLSEDRSRLIVTFERIPASEGLEIRYLMDPSLFIARSSSPGLERLLQDEARIAGIANNSPQNLWRRFTYSVSNALRHLIRHSDVFLDRILPGRSISSTSLFWIVCILFLLLRGTFGIAIAKYRVRRKTSLRRLPYYVFEPPDNLPPAFLVGLKLSKPRAAFHATVMDLARQGYGEFQPQKGFLGKTRFGMVLNLEKDTSNLYVFERKVLDFLRSAARRASPQSLFSRHKPDGYNPTQLTFDKLKSYSQDHKGSMELWYPGLVNEVNIYLGGEMFSKESQEARTGWAFYTIILLMALIVLAVFLSGPEQIVSFIAIPYTIFLAVMAVVILPTMRHRVAAEVYKWRGFKRVLSDFTQMQNAPDDFFKLWDKYYCYAAALGIARRYLRNIQRATSLRGIEPYNSTYSADWLGGSMTSNDNFTDFSDSVTSLSGALASVSASSGGSVAGGSDYGGDSGGGDGGGGGDSGGR